MRNFGSLFHKSLLQRYANIIKIEGNVKEGITYVVVGSSDQVHKRADVVSEDSMSGNVEIKARRSN